MQVHINKNYCHQTWKAVRFRCTNLVETNSKDTDDVIIVRSRDFGKTTKPHVNKGYIHETWIVESSVPLIHLSVIWRLSILSSWISWQYWDVMNNCRRKLKLSNQVTLRFINLAANLSCKMNFFKEISQGSLRIAEQLLGKPLGKKHFCCSRYFTQPWNLQHL